MEPLVPDPDNIRLAVLGSSAGNGHPYSWSAIFNGYDPEALAVECAQFAGIPAYLAKEPSGSIPIEGAAVTHIHCEGDGGFTAESVAHACLIPHVVERPEDVIGHVDAVIVATDRGAEHVARCRPFVEAGVPLFVDKPLVTDEADLATFGEWVASGAAILSSSSMRYAKEFLPFRLSTRDLGQLRFVTIASPKSWEAYGIHALEAVYPILGPGFLSVRNTGTSERNVVHLRHRDGVDVVACLSADMYGAFGVLQLCGTDGFAHAVCRDSFFQFKEQLTSFVTYLRTGERPFPFEETVEMMRMVIAGIRSRDEGGREVALEEIDA